MLSRSNNTIDNLFYYIKASVFIHIPREQQPLIGSSEVVCNDAKIGSQNLDESETQYCNKEFEHQTNLR